ncbi:hypothetical protein D3C78_1171170 [compost metagenome]
MQLGGHAGHGVDLAAQARDEERVHHGVGSDAEVDRSVSREDDLVDRGNALLRVDEQPLPVQRDHVDLHRLHIGIQRTVRVQLVGGVVSEVAQGDDDQDRDDPHRGFDLGRVRPVRGVGGSLVGSTVLPGENHGHDNDRNHHQQHQAGSDQDQVLLLNADLTFRVEQGPVAPTE